MTPQGGSEDCAHDAMCDSTPPANPSSTGHPSRTSCRSRMALRAAEAMDFRRVDCGMPTVSRRGQLLGRKAWVKYMPSSSASVR